MKPIRSIAADTPRGISTQVQEVGFVLVSVGCRAAPIGRLADRRSANPVLAVIPSRVPQVSILRPGTTTARSLECGTTTARVPHPSRSCSSRSVGRIPPTPPLSSLLVSSFFRTPPSHHRSGAPSIAPLSLAMGGTHTAHPAVFAPPISPQNSTFTPTCTCLSLEFAVLAAVNVPNGCSFSPSAATVAAS